MKLLATFTNARSLAKFISSTKACNFDAPFGGDAVFCVRFTIAVKSAADFVYDKAQSLDGQITESFA